MSLFQSNKFTAGKVFEKATKYILKENSIPFDYNIKVNGKPDFIIPGEKSYNEDPSNTIILSVKRTIRERWRQIVTEGQKVKNAKGFFLLTIDEKINENLIKEAKNNNVTFVVPSTNVDDIAKGILTLQMFIKLCHYNLPHISF